MAFRHANFRLSVLLHIILNLFLKIEKREDLQAPLEPHQPAESILPDEAVQVRVKSSYPPRSYHVFNVQVREDEVLWLELFHGYYLLL